MKPGNNWACRVDGVAKLSFVLVLLHVVEIQLRHIFSCFLYVLIKGIEDLLLLLAYLCLSQLTLLMLCDRGVLAYLGFKLALVKSLAD